MSKARAAGAAKPAARRAPARRLDAPPEPPPAGGHAELAAHARVALGGAVLGQGVATTRLAQALSSGRPHHAWIIAGPSGVGKCTLAVRFAAVLVDPETTDADRATLTPPTNSRSAELLRLGTHPDVHLIHKERAATSADAQVRDRKQLNIPLGLLRELMIGGSTDSREFDARVAHSSVLGAGKVFIIDEAELLDADGQNALLKTLEEPPPHTTIVLVASHEDRLLPTIRSRCQRVHCGPLDAASMQSWSSDHLSDDTPHRDWVLQFAAGRPGVALEAVANNLRSWDERCAAILDALGRGRAHPAMAEECVELVGAFAEAAVKANPDASKDAANRKALSLLCAVLGARLQQHLHAAVKRGDATDIDRVGECVEAIVDAERSIASNVNQKLVLANLIAQCAPHLAAGG